MGQILFTGSGGGSTTSDELTVTKELVLEGKSYVGADTDDEAGIGAMPSIAAEDSGSSLNISGDKLHCQMTNGAHITNASSGKPEVTYDLGTVRNAINYTDSSKVLNDTTICGMTGSMPSHSSGQHANSNGVNSSGIWMYIPYGYYKSEGNNQAWVYRTKSEMKDTFKSAYGVNSCSGFNLSSGGDDPSNWGKINVGVKGLSNGSNQPWYGCSIYVDGSWKANLEGSTTASTTITGLSEGSHSVKAKNYYRCNTDLDSSSVIWGSEQTVGNVTAYKSKDVSYWNSGFTDWTTTGTKYRGYLLKFWNPSYIYNGNQLNINYTVTSPSYGNELCWNFNKMLLSTYTEGGTTYYGKSTRVFLDSTSPGTYTYSIPKSQMRQCTDDYVLVEVYVTYYNRDGDLAYYNATGWSISINRIWIS